MARRAIDVDSFHHSNPIPGASRIGPLLASSIIVGRDPGRDHLPESVDEQIANLFHHVGELLAAAGGRWEHVVKMSFYVPDLAIRGAINKPWVEHFPEPDSRPARHTQVSLDAAVSCDFLAYLEDETP